VSELAMIYGMDGHPAWLKDAFDLLIERGLIRITDGGEPVTTREGARFCNDVIGPFLDAHHLGVNEVGKNYSEWGALVGPLLHAKGVTDLGPDANSVLLLIVTRVGTRQRDRSDFGRTLARRKLRA
jgi:hypothetical protein